VGTAQNKNLPRLIDAVAGLACTLVIIGPIPDQVLCQLREAGIDYENHVDLSGPELVRQYEESDLVAFTSVYEGFGLPIIEAQAVGRPVLTSNRPPMFEVAGEGACLVDPTDSKSIRAGIERIVCDAAFRHRLIENGFENIKRYQPQQIARHYLALYEKVLADANGRSAAR
jgi:glycosyltransferase involved in cell wall biosynthesis